MKYAMIIDTTRCSYCYACVVACKDEFVGNPYPPYSSPQLDRGEQWLKVSEVEKGKYPNVKVYSIPVHCMLCEQCAPVEACPIPGCVYKDESGVTIIDPAKCDPSKCNEAKPCVEACPYGVISFNDESNVCQKCTLCAHRVEQGKEPACVDACPSGVYIFGKESELSGEIKKRGAKPMYPERGTKPRVFYVGLPSISLAGHVIDGKSLMDVTGANITISDARTGSSVSCKSDIAGNFLAPDLKMNNAYSVRVECKGYLPKPINNVPVDIEYKHLGEIKLSKSS